MNAKKSRIRVSHGHTNACKVTKARPPRTFGSMRGDGDATTKRHRSRRRTLRRHHSTPARGEEVDSPRIRAQSRHESHLSRLPRARGEYAFTDLHPSSGEGIRRRSLDDHRGD